MCNDLRVDTVAIFRKEVMFFPLPFLLNTIYLFPNGVRYKGDSEYLMPPINSLILNKSFITKDYCSALL